MDFFPEYTLKRGEKTLPYVKLKHLLSMTVPYKVKSEPWKRICGSDDWAKTTLDIENCECYIADNRENHISFITSRESQGRRWLCDTKDEIVVAIASTFKPAVHDRITFIQHNILPYLC